ncbi:MAG: hypothetical protein J6C54_03280 [Lachnospiraceae bacterium]|nr:hypothetical protein [Lachnospiraceae bacterium]
MKKLAMLLVLLLTIALMAGCGGSKKEEKETEPAGNGVQYILNQVQDQQEQNRLENESKEHVGEDKNFTIQSVEDLMAFADSVIGGNMAANATMEADVDLSGTTWTTIEDYNGVFDGNGHSISGMTGEGMFHNLEEQAVIKNLTLENVDLTDGGAIADYSNGLVENCQVTGKMTVTIKEKKQYVGGLVGKMHATEETGGIKDCTSRVDIHCENPDIMSCYVGGIVGITVSRPVENCENYGTITGNGNYVGGIAGRVEKWDATIRGCMNYGDITGRYAVGGVVGNANGLMMDGCGNEGAIEGLVNVGGVVGALAEKDSIWGYMFNCFNHGTVTGQEPVKDMEMQNIAGVLGYNYEGQIVNCYNTGAVTSPAGENKWDYMTGGIAGMDYDNTDQYIYNCYNLGKVSGGRVMALATIDNSMNCYAVTGYENYDIYNGITAVEAAAFTDGTVLSGLQSFDGQNLEEDIPEMIEKYSITLSGWVQGENGPALDWE